MNRLENALQIQSQRLLLNVFHIEHNLLLWLEIVAAVDLCPAGQAGFYNQAVVKTVNIGFKFIIKTFPFRSRTNKAHVAFQDIPKLRQLVQSGLPKNPPQMGAARIILICPLRPVFFCVKPHGSEFHNCKWLSIDEIGEKLDALLNDPKQFGKIAQLASSILGDGGGQQAPPSAPEPELDVDMGQLRRMMSALRGGGHDSANRHLLEAMKPYLAEKRRRKIDRAMKLARLASLAELAAEDLEGDDHV